LKAVKKVKCTKWCCSSKPECYVEIPFFSFGFCYSNSTAENNSVSWSPLFVQAFKYFIDVL